MADAVAIVQAAAPAAVALAAIWFASRRQTRGFDLDRQLADRAELRDLLDEATQNLTEARGQAGALSSTLLFHAMSQEQVDHQVQEFKVAGRAVHLTHDRLTIRLGTEAPAVRAHALARDGVEDVARAVNILGPGNPGAVAESWKAVTDATPKIDTGRDQFVRAAVELIGVESGSAGARRRLRLVRTAPKA